MDSVSGGLSRNQRRANRRHEKLLSDAIEKRERLLEREKFSVPQDVGKIAILVSTARMQENNTGNILDHFAAVEPLKRKADEIVDFFGRDRAYMQYAIPRTIRSAIRNRRVSDIIVLGHGNIGNIHLPNEENFNWADVSLASRHLKTGKFIQITCGGFRQDGLSVPLGTFAVSQLSSVEAAPGYYLSGENPEEELIRPVYDAGVDLRAQIDVLNVVYTPEQTEK